LQARPITALTCQGEQVDSDRDAIKKIGKAFADRQSVNHSAGESVRGAAYTYSIEGFSVGSNAA